MKHGEVYLVRLKTRDVVQGSRRQDLSGFWAQMSGQKENFKSVRILTEKLKTSGFQMKGKDRKGVPTLLFYVAQVCDVATLKTEILTGLSKLI